MLDVHPLAKLQIEPKNNHRFENLEGSIFAWLFGCLFVVWLVVCLHVGNTSDVTLAFKDAQVIQPLSREKTYNTDDTDDTEEYRNIGM